MGGERGRVHAQKPSSHLCEPHVRSHCTQPLELRGRFHLLCARRAECPGAVVQVLPLTAPSSPSLLSNLPPHSCPKVVCARLVFGHAGPLPPQPVEDLVKKIEAGYPVTICMTCKVDHLLTTGTTGLQLCLTTSPSPSPSPLPMHPVLFARVCPLSAGTRRTRFM